MLPDQTREGTHCRLGSSGDVTFCLSSGCVCVGEPSQESLAPLQTLLASSVSFRSALSLSSFGVIRVRARTERPCPMGRPARPGHRGAAVGLDESWEPGTGVASLSFPGCGPEGAAHLGREAGQRLWLEPRGRAEWAVCVLTRLARQQGKGPS